MSAPLILCLVAVFGQVGLTFWAIVRMGTVRVAAIKSGKVGFGDIAIHTTAYPEAVQTYQSNAHNQFETPSLLYAAVALGAALGEVNWLMAIAALAYLASRLVHRRIHIGTNHLPSRFRAFVAGLMALGLLWVSLGLGLLF